MNKIERIKKNIKNNKELFKRITKTNYQNSDDVESFIESAKRYIKAVKEGRMLYAVTSVSSSGMSRHINIKSCERNKNGKKFYYCQYYYFLKCMGERFDKYRDDIIVSGCGMNMVFATNYNIMHSLKRLGFISEKECAVLSQAIN